MPRVQVMLQFLALGAGGRRRIEAARGVAPIFPDADGAQVGLCCVGDADRVW